MRPPRWIDEEDVRKLVKQRLQELRDEVWRFDPNSEWGTVLVYRDRRMDPAAPLPTKAHELMRKLVLAKIKREWDGGEQAAVEAALRGDLRPLAGLLVPLKIPQFRIYKVNPAIARLRLETWELIVEFLLGERNPKTGKKKGEPGRPKMNEEERRKKAPVHDAAELVPVIVEILRNMFPQQRPKDIRKRAIEIAAKIKRMPSEKLANYLSRPRADPRRLRSTT